MRSTQPQPGLMAITNYAEHGHDEPKPAGSPPGTGENRAGIFIHPEPRT